MSVKLSVDIKSMRFENVRLLEIANSIGSTKSILTKLHSTIDPRILERKNLQRRLVKVCNDIAFIESQLLELFSVIDQTLTGYENLERNRTLEFGKISLGIGAASSNFSKNRNAFASSTPPTTAALGWAKKGAEIFKTGATVNGISRVGMLNTTKSGSHVIVSGSSNVRAATGMKGTRLTQSTFNNQVVRAGTSSKSVEIAGKVGSGISIAYGGVRVASSIWNDINAGATTSRIVTNATVETGHQAVRHTVTKKTVAASTKGGAKTGAKIGMILGPKGAVVGAAAGAIVGAAAGAIVSGVVTNVGRNVVNGASNLARNVFNRFRR